MAVGTEGHREDFVGVAGEDGVRARGRRVGDVPEAPGAVGAARRQKTAIRAERDRQYRVGVSLQSGKGFRGAR